MSVLLLTQDVSEWAYLVLKEISTHWYSLTTPSGMLLRRRLILKAGLLLGLGTGSNVEIETSHIGIIFSFRTTGSTVCLLMGPVCLLFPC